MPGDLQLLATPSKVAYKAFSTSVILYNRMEYYCLYIQLISKYGENPLRVLLWNDRDYRYFS